MTKIRDFPDHWKCITRSGSVYHLRPGGTSTIVTNSGVEKFARWKLVIRTEGASVAGILSGGFDCDHFEPQVGDAIYSDNMRTWRISSDIIKVEEIY